MTDKNDSLKIYICDVYLIGNHLMYYFYFIFYCSHMMEHERWDVWQLVLIWLVRIKRG